MSDDAVSRGFDLDRAWLLHLWVVREFASVVRISRTASHLPGMRVPPLGVDPAELVAFEGALERWPPSSMIIGPPKEDETQ